MHFNSLRYSLAKNSQAAKKLMAIHAETKDPALEAERKKCMTKASPCSNVSPWKTKETEIGNLQETGASCSDMKTVLKPSENRN